MMPELNQRVSQEIKTRIDELSEAIVARIYELEPEFLTLYGEVGRTKCLRDVNYHLSYLSESIAASSSSLLVDYATWVNVVMFGLDGPVQNFERDLTRLRDILPVMLPEKMRTIVREYISNYLEAGLRQLSQAPSVPPILISEDLPLAGLAKEYLDALLRGERHIASQLILDAVESDVSIKDIYLHVFQRSQHEVGRLWQRNQLSVAQEHYCTAATQLIMSQLYPRIFTSEKIGRRLVAACVGGELHEIGVRMVADFFEIEGWDTYYLGANTPAESILQTIEERQPDILGLSTTMLFHVSSAREIIDLVRSSDAGKRVKILVGGYPFNVEPDLWQKLGADGYARNAQAAIELANRLVAEGDE
ncbi:cobalamin B12-binding domain-containing protein [bacterium]|nr:cobalamin B12-binding domain-containing protein [bacterium]